MGDCGKHFGEMRLVPGGDAVAHQFAFFGGAVLHQVDQWQRWLAFPQIVSDVLADVSGVAGIVEYVVDQLECSAQRAAVFCRRSNRGLRRAGKQAAQFGRCLEQFGCL